MTKINKKIGGLEDRICDEFKWQSTFVAPECLTETENRLFDHVHKIVRLHPRKTEQLIEFIEVIDKTIYYYVRRGVDLFMKTMGAQLDCREKFLFWVRFVDFVSETMFILSRTRGSAFITGSILGENPDDWPDDDDPLWKELEAADNKWNRDFKELWDYTSVTREKIFSIMQDNIEERISKQEEFEIEETTSPNESRMYKFFAECISNGLSRPSRIDIIHLAALSLSNKDKTLLKMLSEPKAQQQLNI